MSLPLGLIVSLDVLVHGQCSSGYELTSGFVWQCVDVGLQCPHHCSPTESLSDAQVQCVQCALSHTPNFKIVDAQRMHTWDVPQQRHTNDATLFARSEEEHLLYKNILHASLYKKITSFEYLRTIDHLHLVQEEYPLNL